MKSRILLFGSVTVLLLATFVVFLFPHYDPKTYVRKSVSYSRIHDIAVMGAAISKYQFENGKRLPNQLSQLIPKYLQSTNENVGFVYVGERGISQNLILYESPTVWLPDSKITNILTVAADFSVKPLTRQELEVCISNLNATGKP